jgi:lysophospholipase L1-like esterase
MNGDVPPRPDVPDAGSYNPCPATGPCLIMPLGDSITDGAGSSDGSSYRTALRTLATTDGLMLDFVGTQVHPSGHHEGHSGWVIQQIRDSIDMFVANATDSRNARARPHVVLLMIGTNDTNRNLDLATAPTRLGDLVDRIATDVPDALIVVAQIVPNGDTNLDRNAVGPFNAAIPDLVRTRAAAGRHVVMVDMHSALNTMTDFADGLHPNDRGYGRMAAVWFPVVRPLLHR